MRYNAQLEGVTAAANALRRAALANVKAYQLEMIAKPLEVEYPEYPLFVEYFRGILGVRA
jgi:hypothetical protein